MAKRRNATTTAVVSEGNTIPCALWPIDKPIDYPKNARKWSNAAVAKVAKSLQEFGFRQPIVVDEFDIIIIGHLRRAAAKVAGFQEVPVHVADLPPAKARALRLMDNRSHDEAEWAMDLLAEEMRELAAIDLDLSLTGFDKFEWPSEGVSPEWSGMPEYTHEDQEAFQTVSVHFPSVEARERFAGVVGQEITERTRYLWFPPAEIGRYANKRYTSKDPNGPQFPVYIVSKGRWETRLTSKALEEIGVPYRIVVEPQERDLYASVIDPSKILTLPFSNLGLGSIPARNWIWEHAISEGLGARHWILDDNIQAFYRFNRNLKVPVSSGDIFRAAEDFTDRYDNIALSGFQYFMFVTRKNARIPPFAVNTRIYSCILINNSLPYRWRGRYNEDTDLSLRALKDGRCTILFNAFLAEKMPTLSMKGGNTDELYAEDGRLKMAESLKDQHPDVVKITRKWGRWQHQVNYKPFRNNKFMPKAGFTPPTEEDNYGMELEQVL